MPTIYHHRLHAHKIPRFKPWQYVLGFVVLVTIVSGVTLLFLPAQSSVQNDASSTKTLATPAADQTVQHGTFSMQLPAGWRFTGKQKDIHTIYHFAAPPEDAATSKTGTQFIDVYENSSRLQNFAVNRMVPVRLNAQGGITAQYSEVSDECTAYTAGETRDRTAVGQLAKWQGITFLCDMLNTTRNVVGTGSTDGLNTFTLGKQRYFLTYTDNRDKPDYTTFITALNSFKSIK